MKNAFTMSFVLLVLVGVLSAQQASNSTGANSSTNTSVSADKSGANVQSDNRADVSNQTDAATPHRQPEQRSGKHQPKEQSSTSGTADGSLAAGTTINTVLAKPLDSRKCKPGDEVLATASQDVKSDGRVIVRKGSKVIGHVTEAKAKSQGEANSALGIVFDHAVLPNGHQVQLNGVVQAIAAPRGASSSIDEGASSDLSSGDGMVSSASRSSGGLLSGAGSTVSSTTGAVGSVGGSATGAVNSTVGSAANVGRGVNGTLGSNSSGVVGLRGLSLATDAANSTEGSVITSSSKSIHLDKGTQLLFRVAK